MDNHLIRPVANNSDKAYTYGKMKGRYKKAMAEHFYFEAVMIDYAVLEDRLRSFLYHIGALTNRTSQKLDQKNTKQFLLGLYNEQYHKNKKGLSISGISTKYDLIRAVLEWVNTAEGVEDKYARTLKHACESLDLDDVFHCLDEIEAWCKYRNELIHGLMNKDLMSLYAEIGDKAKEGMELAVRVDAYVDTVSKRNTIRKSIKLKTN